MYYRREVDGGSNTSSLVEPALFEVVANNFDSSPLHLHRHRSAKRILISFPSRGHDPSILVLKPRV